MDSSLSVPRPRVKNHLVEVTGVTDLTWWYRRLTMDARGLFEIYTPAPGAYLTLNLAGGARSYSPHGVTASTFLLDFVLHTPTGPGSGWAAAARQGTRVTVSEPPYSLTIPDVSHALLIADPSALAGVSHLLESIDTRMEVTVLIEDDHADHDHITLPTRENTQIQWLETIDANDLGHITAHLDPNDCFLWAAGERRLAKTVREFARGEFLVPRPAQHIQTYWIAGR